MPEWAKHSLLIAAAAWSASYFGKLVWVGLKTGQLIDSRPLDGRPVTRGTKPIVFWLSVGGAAVFIPLFLWLIGYLAGDLAGLWETTL